MSVKFNDLMHTEKEEVESEKMLADDKTREKLKEEIKFDKRVYGGISYAAQAVTGIVLLRWLSHGSAKPHFDKLAGWVGKNLFGAKGGAEEAVKAGLKFTTVSTMIMVGNTFLLPVKWLENRKPEIVKKMYENRVASDEACGIVRTEVEKAHQDDMLKQLEQEPKQTWRSLLEGRAVGLGAVYAALIVFKKQNQQLEDYAVKNILKGVEGAGMKEMAKSEKLSQYLHIGFLDVFYSAVATAGLYVYSHTIRPPKKDTQAAADNAPEAIETPFAATMASLNEPAAPVLAPESFVSRVKPKAPVTAPTIPSEFFTKRLAAEEQREIAHTAV